MQRDKVASQALLLLCGAELIKVLLGYVLLTGKEAAVHIR